MYAEEKPFSPPPPCLIVTINHMLNLNAQHLIQHIPLMNTTLLLWISAKDWDIERQSWEGQSVSWGELPKGVGEVCAAKSFLCQDRERVAQAVGVMLRW